MTDSRKLRHRLQRATLTLLHNCIAHPLAGLLWAVGAHRAGDRVHALWQGWLD